MEMLIQPHEAAALLARVFLGLLFFFQGYDAIVNIGMRNVVSTYEYDFANSGIPRFLTRLAAWFTSGSELICGAFLVLGLFKYTALYLLGINLIVAGIGFGLTTAVWDLRHVFPRLLLILFLLIIPPSWDVCQLQHFLRY